MEEHEEIMKELKERMEEDTNFRQRALDKFIAENNKSEAPMGRFTEIVIGVCRIYQRTTERILARIETRAAINTEILLRIQKQLNTRENADTSATKKSPEFDD